MVSFVGFDGIIEYIFSFYDSIFDWISYVDYSVVFRMTKIAEEVILFLCGQRKTGKTYLAQNWFIPKAKKHVFIYDSTGEHLAKFKNDPNVTVYKPFNPEPKDFEEWCKIVWETGNCIAVIEEGSNVLPSRMSFRKFPYANKLITQGRHAENGSIGMIIISQRPSDMASKCLSQSDQVYIFRLFAPCDINALSQYVGSEWAKVIQKLPDRHFIHYDRHGIRKCPPIKV